MNKLRILLLGGLIFFFLFGCSFVTTNTTTPTTSNDSRYQVIEEEFTYVDEVIPSAILNDYLLPPLHNLELSVSYSIDDALLDSQTITYIKSAQDILYTLKVTIFYEDISVSKDYTFYMIRDAELYNQYLTDQSFIEIKAMIDEGIPNVIDSDFTLPVIDLEGVKVSYSTDTSRIFNNRFIFSFPVQPKEFHITARVSLDSKTMEYTFPVTMKGLNQLPQIPVMYITGQNNQWVTSKETYINATFSMVVYDDDLNPTTLMSNQAIQIRGRGNSTFFMPKQSFRIKFPEKTSLVFDYSENDWVLLANYADQTLIRDYLAYNFASALDMDFSPSAAFVDVYYNNQYMGNYTLSDQIEVSNDRVDVEEKSTNTDTGYLIEFDKRLWEYPEGVEGIDWFNVYGIPYSIKSPKTDSEYYTSDQFYYIESYIALCMNTLMNQGDYSNLIDEESFIDWFIVEELFKNVDSGYSSVYIVKDKGGKLKMGPVWDFDLSTTNPGHLQDDLRGPEGWYTSRSDKNPWYYYLMQYPTFREHLKDRWNEIYDNQVQDLIQSVYPAADSITKSRYLNFQKWNIIGINYDWYTSPEVYNAKTYEAQLKLLYDFLYDRSIWMNEAINDF
ncbi:MAG: CotH kinase family protein [Candidatus Izemoplasmatales bacterium]|jgi:glycerol-3-phosphate cytidylyltransferase-like family protein|nr:CotH kinase family protein [Candidatus Izemoplasmatales bacterium]